MTNKAIGEKSKCANCMSNKSRFLKQKPNKKVIGIILILNFSYTNHYKTRWHIDESAKKYRLCEFKRFIN